MGLLCTFMSNVSIMNGFISGGCANNFFSISALSKDSINTSDICYHVILHIGNWNIQNASNFLKFKITKSRDLLFEIIVCGRFSKLFTIKRKVFSMGNLT